MRRLLQACLLAIIILTGAAPAIAADPIAWRYQEAVDRAHPAGFEVLPNGNILYCRTSFFAPAVVEITPAGQEIWRYGPVPAASARRLKNGNTLIADSGMPGPPRQPAVLEVTPQGQVAWRYDFDSRAEAPRVLQPLASGRVLVATRDTVLELDPEEDEVAWRYAPGDLFNLASATRLASGNTLLVDAGIGLGGKVREINQRGQTVWEFRGEARLGRLLRPLAANRLADGRTLIVDGGQNRLLTVAPAGQVLGVNAWPELSSINLWSAQPISEERVLLAFSRWGRGQLVDYRGRLPKVMLDNSAYLPAAVPLKKQTALFGARELFDLLGATLNWSQADKRLEVSLRGHNLTLQVGLNQAILDGGRVIELASPPEIAANKLYLPATAFALLGGGRWDEAGQTLYLERPKKT